jgi:hypothetical protein
MKCHAISPMQTLLLLDLLSRGGEAFLSDIKKPEYSLKEHRLPLIGLGLLEEREERRRDPAHPGGKPKGKAIKLLSLTAGAYGHLALAMKGATPPGSPACGPVMSRLLARVSSFMDLNGLTVSDVYNDPPFKLASGDTGATPPPKPYSPPPGAREFSRMLKAFPRGLMTAGGGIMMSALKGHFRDMDPEDIDRLLIELQNDGEIVLYPSVLPLPEEKAAAVLVGGDPRHMVFFPR